MTLQQFTDLYLPFESQLPLYSLYQALRTGQKTELTNNKESQFLACYKILEELNKARTPKGKRAPKPTFMETLHFMTENE